MKLAIDIDDVLSDSLTALITFHNETYGSSYTDENILEFSYWGFLGAKREEANKKYFEFTDSPYFFETKPLKGAVEAMKTLSARGHELYVITGRPLFVKEKTELWLAKHFPNIFQELFWTNARLDKTDYSSYWGRPKAEICKEIGATVLVDDLLEYARDSEGLSVIILNRFWNQKAALESNMIRANDWQEVVNEVDKLRTKTDTTEMESSITSR